MKKFYIVAALTLFTTFNSSAGVMDQLRPYSMKFLGEEVTVKIFGEEKDKIEMPEIPEIISDSKSAVKDKVDDKEKNISEENRKKYNYIYIRDLFQVTRNIAANENDIAKWMNVMGQGASREGVYRALVLDDTYAGLENFDNTAKGEVAMFAMNFLETYANKVVSKESLEKANFYTLKRVLVERTLEVVDALANDEEKLYDWYAVVSADMAKKHNGVWTNKIRKTSSKKTHRQWAKKVPLQYLKGEVIIKLHRICNYLNS